MKRGCRTPDDIREDSSDRSSSVSICRVLLQFSGSGNPGNDPGSGKGFPGSNSRSKKFYALKRKKSIPHILAMKSIWESGKSNPNFGTFQGSKSFGPYISQTPISEVYGKVLLLNT